MKSEKHTHILSQMLHDYAGTSLHVEGKGRKENSTHNIENGYIMTEVIN